MKFQLVIRVQTSQGSEVYVKSNILDAYPKNDFVERVCVDTFDCVSYKVELIREKLDITWKHVFNSSLYLWGNIANASKQASDMGYKYYTWNGKVYSIVAVDVEHWDMLEEEL